MEFYIGHRTPQPQPTVSPPAVLPPVLVPSPRLPPRDKVVDVFSPTPREKEIHFFPPSPRDKVVSVLLPSPVRQVLEPSIENLVMPQMNQVPQSDVSPSVLPTPISLMNNEPGVIPAFDQRINRVVQRRSRRNPQFQLVTECGVNFSGSRRPLK